jgi:glutathione S-transferase
MLHELTGSPNSVKIRIALGYKGLDYERQPVDLDDFPGDRATAVSLSRQPRFPILQHGDAVIFDSSAILRYIEANFRETPSIFTDDYATFGEIETWEAFASTQIGPPIGMAFGQAFAPEADLDALAQANEMLSDCTAELEQKVGADKFLVGDGLTAADIVCAAPLYLTDMTAEMAAQHPITQFFGDNLKLGDDRPQTREWLRRLMAYDTVLGQRTMSTA